MRLLGGGGQAMSLACCTHAYRCRVTLALLPYENLTLAKRGATDASIRQRALRAD